MIQPMQILVLGPEGLGRSALEETLTRLGYVVMAAEARPDGQAPSSGDIVMLDMRGEDAEWGNLAEGLHGDDRPVMIVSERPRRLMRALSGRAAGTIFLLVMLGVILLAAGAPRLGGSERIWLSGLVGPRSGHGLAVRRPG